MSGKVFLIGAGPGDPMLLTLKGKSILEKADVVVYDRLVSPAILGMCAPSAKMVDVGKMPTHHKVKQSEINRLLVKFAKEYPEGIIARLKGGDPFVFGRGGEEALELKSSGIDFEIVPGITSAISVPAYAGIPVSHRGIATSFHIITGHEKVENENAIGHSLKSNLGLDFENLANCKGSLIFLMGIANMEQIALKLMAFGKNPKTPVAFIEKGTTPYQRTVITTLETAAQTIEKEKVTAPAITIMGDVVNLAQDLSWKKNLPLSGIRLTITRAQKQSGSISEKLSALGAEIIETPMIETETLDSPIALGENVNFDSLKNFDVLAFTSVNGVDSFFKQLFKAGLDIRILAGKKIASVGKITEKKLLSFGIKCDYVPSDHTGAGLGDLLQKELGEFAKNILLVQGNLADDTLLKKLPHATRWIVYKTVEAAPLPLWKIEAVKAAQAVVFASSSAVENFVKVMNKSTVNDFENEQKSPKLAFTIGKLTDATAKKHGFNTVMSEDTTMDSLVKKIAEYYGA